jgi:hypothetical protein
MKTSRFNEIQIVSILKQTDPGVPVKDVCRQAGISVASYYQWKSKYGGMEASDLKRGRSWRRRTDCSSGCMSSWRSTTQRSRI